MSNVVILFLLSFFVDKQHYELNFVACQHENELKIECFVVFQFVKAM
ncbi:hypothetical protein LLNZ_00625 [Lactococcus cremoris subsp. cremoris NZ9000]|nr:hypothetical protein LLNZ_00625 [Lactococcus cremoris subsp. cremoris NZ9000]